MRSLDEQKTPRLNTLEGNPVQLGKEDGGQRAEDGKIRRLENQKVRGQRTECGVHAVFAIREAVVQVGPE